jgi:hypothetical protein
LQFSTRGSKLQGIVLPPGPSRHIPVKTCVHKKLTADSPRLRCGEEGCRKLLAFDIIFSVRPEGDNH